MEQSNSVWYSIYIIFNNQQQREAWMRNRSQSPIQTYPPQPKKYYTRQQVSQILRTMMQTKLTNIYQQLQEKQHMIRTLNDKLNNNDTYIQNLTQQIYQLETHIAQTQADNTFQLVHRLLSQKLQGYWNTVQAELNHIRTQCQESIKKYHHNLSNKNDQVVGEIKKVCEDNVEAFKKKNNAYWIKVKEALNKMNTRTTQNEQKMSNIGIQINKYQTQREENIKTVKQLENGKNTAKMLVQLKKSVNNVYKNFEEVLKLQKTVKENYEKMGSLDRWNYDKYPNPQSTNAKTQWNYQRTSNKTTLNKQDDIVILEYSVQEDTLSNHQIPSNVPIKQQAMSRPHAKSQSIKNSSPFKMKPVQNFPLSPITGRVIQNSSFSNTQVLLGSERYKTNHQTAVTNASIKNQTLEWVQHEEYGNPQHFYPDGAKNDRSESFQLTPLNSSNHAVINHNANSRMLTSSHNNAVSTSMLNFSLECRKQMLESVRPRLLEMIQTKGLNKPIRVFLDQINYLKNEDGNYLFDLKGNMFKLNPNQFAELQRDKVVVNVKNTQLRKSRK